MKKKRPIRTHFHNPEGGGYRPAQQIHKPKHKYDRKDKTWQKEEEE